MPSARLPTAEPRIPRSWDPLPRALGRLALRILRFRIVGGIPDLPKLVIIAAPHTTNWDFIIGISARLALGIRVLFLGKHTLFAWPLGWLMRALGGMPVDRSGSSDLVNAIVAEFARRESLILAIAPEGTRKQVQRWRTGFYHIAHGAGAPIVPVAFDWGTRTIEIGPPFVTTGDIGADLPLLQSYFTLARGRRA